MKDKYRVNRNQERLKKWKNAKMKAMMPKYKSGDTKEYMGLFNKWIKEWVEIKEDEKNG